MRSERGREGGRREKESERETRDVIGKIRDLVFEETVENPVMRLSGIYAIMMLNVFSAR